jgi:hypothetical protein
LLKSLEEPSPRLHFILRLANAKLLPLTLRSRCWYLPLASDIEGGYDAVSSLVKALKQDIFAYIQETLDLLSLIKKYENQSLDDLFLALEYLNHDLMLKRFGGQHKLDYDIAFQVSLPTSVWWAFWEKLLHYRTIYRRQTSLNPSLILGDLFLILRAVVPTSKGSYADITFS